MTTTIRIKAGAAEFEYEGETEVSLSDLKELLDKVEAWSITASVENQDNDGPENKQSAAPSKPASAQQLHINSIAKKISAKTGPELAVAAAARLQIVDGKETFSRSELLDTMKKATMHYKSNMSGNLTSILNSLTGSKLNQVSDGVYSLTSEEFSSLESQIG